MFINYTLLHAITGTNSGLEFYEIPLARNVSILLLWLKERLCRMN